MTRNHTIDILKGLGIIFVVVVHSRCPNFYLSSFVMPLFLIASGFFFKEIYLDSKKEYLKRKVRGLYLPFLKWSLIFLLLHNLFFHVGILNDAYGNTYGQRSHLYSPNEIITHVLNITFTMSDYEVFLLGAYWFIRALFVGCLLLCFCSFAINKIVKSKSRSIAIVAIAFCLLGGLMTFFHFRIPYFPQGGYREVMSVFFLGCGYFISKAHHYMERWYVAWGALCMLVFANGVRQQSMGYLSVFADWVVLPWAGICGTVFVYYVSSNIAKRDNAFSRTLIYIGQNTFYILTFHFLMFKPAMLLNAFYYHLDWKVIGCHPVVLPVRDHWFWIIYSLTSLILSLAMTKVIKKLPFRL